MANLKIKAFFEKLVHKARKNKLRGASAAIYGSSSEEVTIGDGSANASSYKQIVPRGILNTDFEYVTNSKGASLFELGYHSSSTSTVKYPQIKVKQAGLYLIDSTVYFSKSYTAGDRVYIVIYVNNVADNRHWFAERMSGTYQVGQLTRLVYLNANDVVQVRASNYTSAGRGYIYFSGATNIALTLVNPTI